MQRCEIFIGEIVSHPCSAGAVRRCVACERAVCDHHLAPDPTNPTGARSGRCVECAGLYIAPGGRTRVTRDEFRMFTDEEFAIFDVDADKDEFLLSKYDS